MDQSIRAIHEKVKQSSVFVQALKQEIGRVIVGQDYLVERMLVGLLADGHVLLEGVPGLAKTLAVRTLARAVDTHFQRIQFTPDLLPADLIGTQIYNPRESQFTVKKGPIFTNLLLADEINRAPSKVQSALLEAMQEHQVTIGAERRESPVLGNDVFIGAGAKIIGSVTIGDGARIGANAVVVRDVPAHATAVGIPARVVRIRNADGGDPVEVDHA